MKILIGNAWPYANGSLHIGHIAGLLPGDVIARYHRAIGNKVYFVSGTDCHGTPVAIRAKQDNENPQEISDRYHDEFVKVFNALGFSYDRYGKTSEEYHKHTVTEFHERMYKSSLIYEKTSPEAFCKTCGTFLTDRFVAGKCPSCGKRARGDQCDECGTVLEPYTLIEPRCEICGTEPIFTESKHLYLALSKLKEQFELYLATHKNWRKNAQAFTKKYLDEGLRDRAITRLLDWGIDVPKEGYSDKKIYIWAENVLGYYSMSKSICDTAEFEELWTGSDSKHYMCHGKDNIPFHTIIFPALLLSYSENLPVPLHLPDEIISSEYMTLEGRKISTSQNWAVWMKDILHLDPDSLRYFFIINGPEKRDSDFSWREYITRHNSELLGAYGNFINRNVAFINKYYGSIIPNGTIDDTICKKIELLYSSVGNGIDTGALKESLESIFEFVRFSNKYFDQNEPWKTRESSPDHCANVLFNCVQIIANLSVLLDPFLPFSSEKVRSWLNISNRWEPHFVPVGYCMPETEILFKRLDITDVIPSK